MNHNPYKKEIIAIVILGILLIILETWRRWGNLLSYAYLDDVILVSLALIFGFFRSEASRLFVSDPPKQINNLSSADLFLFIFLNRNESRSMAYLGPLNTRAPGFIENLEFLISTA